MSADVLKSVIRHIPMDYLQRHDAEGATGPTDALNVEAAMRDYAEDRWKLIDRHRALKSLNDDLLSIVKRFVALPCSAWHPERHAAEEAELMTEAYAAIAKAEGRS